MMNIQYVGFLVKGGSRAYNFLVTDAPRTPREFTVSIRFNAFRATTLKFQDGPDICFARLKRELERETEDVRTVPSFNIVDDDVQAYLQKHHLQKRS